MPDPRSEESRRTFLTRATGAAVTGGLALGYGACGAMGVRYLYPARPRPMTWQLVARVADMARGGSLTYRAPGGERVAVARLGDGVTPDDFIALSSTCPHLGCQVHWEGNNDRFFCPCHNGVFDPEGRAVSGPPADAGQALPRYELDVRDGLLYIQVPAGGARG